jgi:hypothetical protein
VASAAGYLSFDTFDIQKVLTSGTPLVASGGQVLFFLLFFIPLFSFIHLFIHPYLLEQSNFLKYRTNHTCFVIFIYNHEQEYDFMVEDMDPKELVAFQKKQLRQRLGLEAGGDFMDMGDMLGDEDFIVSAEQAKQRKKYTSPLFVFFTGLFLFIWSSLSNGVLLKFGLELLAYPKIQNSNFVRTRQYDLVTVMTIFAQ